MELMELQINNIEDIDDDHDENMVECVWKRYIRDILNPFEFYNLEFKRHYRFGKDFVFMAYYQKLKKAWPKLIIVFYQFHQ